MDSRYENRERTRCQLIYGNYIMGHQLIYGRVMYFIIPLMRTDIPLLLL